jgi:tetratricopeptide (TPR) repeat protein
MLEGWVTGLILVHESGKGTVEGIGGKPFLRVGSGDRIFDYLYHEVFRRLDPSLQMTMMRLALVDSFSIKSASRLISGADLSAQIRFLLGHHLIYETPVEDQIRFRYHPLLQQFLRNQVRTLPKIELQTLVDQVGAADEAEAMVDHAITLYLEYGHHDQAIRLIEEIGLRYTLEGKRHLLRQWVRSVPTERLALHPWLRYFLGNDQAFFNPVEAQESYRLAVAGFEKNGDLEGQLWARSSRMMLSVYAGFDFRPIKEDAKWGEQTIKGRIGSSLARASFLLADAFSGLAATDNPQHALRKALEAAELARQAGSNMLSARALTRAGFSAGYLGHHRQAMSLFDQSEAVCAWEKLDPPLRAEALIYRGLVETYRGDKILSRKYLLEAQQICLEFGLKAQLPLMQSYLIWSRVTLGEREEGDDSLEPVRKQLLASGNFYFAAAISHSQAVLSLEGGNLLEALRHEEESLRLVQRCHTRFLLLIPLAVLGAIWGELRERTKAEKYLQRALAGFERAGSDMFSFMALMHLAKISLDHGDEEKTKKYLTRALHCGKNERYLVGEGIRPKMMGSLLSRARQWGIEPRYVESLIDFWQIRPESPLKIYTLGRFELILDGQPIPEQAWRGRKTQLLLIALLSLGAGEHKEKIMDLLWPDSDGDRAVINFHTTLHRLQSVFGHTDKESGFIRLLYGRLSLNPISCWSDCDAFEKAAHQARDAQSAGRWSEAERHLQKAHALYQGDYLPTFSQEIWIEEKRRKLRSEFDWVRRNLKT